MSKRALVIASLGPIHASCRVFRKERDSRFVTQEPASQTQRHAVFLFAIQPFVHDLLSSSPCLYTTSPRNLLIPTVTILPTVRIFPTSELVRNL